MLLQRVRLGYSTKEELYGGFHGEECCHCGRHIPTHCCTTSCLVRRQPPSDQRGHYQASLKTVVFSPSVRQGQPILPPTYPQT